MPTLDDLPSALEAIDTLAAQCEGLMRHHDRHYTIAIIPDDPNEQIWLYVDGREVNAQEDRVLEWVSAAINMRALNA